ncbi:hypothetical protein P3X46_032569 [Hevea brasiliensis]|uniref:Retrotransposon gag domain-containing protein n=1 Tax=Hevea brasiliensis TaxID=3981 RepID=A0ABQ9KDQ2_HEVBR|nr:hypothetical protein P3X46_032569 [Hevea brasiliensis]
MIIGLAQIWYQSLKPGSIQNFHQLANKFKNKFISSIPPKKLSLDLQKIKQPEGKSLRDHITHFNTEIIQIENLNHKTTYKALKKGTRNVKFLDSLIKNPALDYYQLMKKSTSSLTTNDKLEERKEIQTK